MLERVLEPEVMDDAEEAKQYHAMDHRSKNVTYEHLVTLHAAEATDQQQTMFRHSLLAALNLDEMRSFAATLGFDSATVQESSDRHWTWAAQLES